MDTCVTSCRRWTKTEIRHGWRSQVSISMWQRTSPKVLWWYVAGKNDICDTNTPPVVFVWWWTGGEPMWCKHPTSDVCMVMDRRRTHVIQTPHQWCMYGDDGQEENPITSIYYRLRRIWEVQVSHSQRKCKSSTSAILPVDRITVCRPSVSSFIRTCLRIRKWSSTSHDLLEGVDYEFVFEFFRSSYFFFCPSHPFCFDWSNHPNEIKTHKRYTRYYSTPSDDTR